MRNSITKKLFTIVKSAFILSCVVGSFSSPLALDAPAEAASKKPAKISSYLKENQQLYESPTVYEMKGWTWSGKSSFIFFVTPVTSSGSTVSVRIDKIIRVWFADELGYWAIRQTNCREFPCRDEKGTNFPAPPPLPKNTEIGSVVVVDKSDLTNRATLMQRENSGSYGYFDDKNYMD